MDQTNIPPMTRVISKNVKAIGFDGRSLFVSFRSGGVYAYDGCPADVYGEGIISPSPTQWLKNKVKGKYPYRKVQVDVAPDRR